MIAFLQSQPKKPIDQNALPDRVIPRISKRAKRLSLRVDSINATVQLIIPQHCPNQKAIQFANQHQGWIVEKLATLPPATPFVNGQTIPILGKNRTLIITHTKTSNIALTPENLTVQTRRAAPEGEIRRFLKKLAHDHFIPLLQQKAAHIGHASPVLSLRDTKSRWGSCGHDGKIMLSWRLILTPPDVMDYVIAHEVAHLEHMNHGPKFWALCEKLCEGNMNQSRQWLRDHGSNVLRIGR